MGSCPRSQLVSGGGTSLKPTPEPMCFTPALHNLEMFVIPIILIPHSKHLQIQLIFLPFTHFTQLYFSLHCHHLRKFWFPLLPSTLHMTPKINAPKMLLSSHPTCSDPSTAPFHLQSEAHAPLGPSSAGPVPTVSSHAAREPSPPATWSPHPGVIQASPLVLPPLCSHWPFPRNASSVPFQTLHVLYPSSAVYSSNLWVSLRRPETV